MDILQRPNTMPSDTEPKNLITLIYRNWNMNGPEQFIEIVEKPLLTIC